MTMVEHHLKGPPMSERIRARLRNSGAGAEPDEVTQTGEGPGRTFTNLHHSANVGAHGRPEAVDVNDKQALIDLYHQRKARGEC
jgi:hypothetical protein